MADLRVLNMSNTFSSVLTANLCNKCSMAYRGPPTISKCKEMFDRGILHSFEMHAFIMIFKAISLGS